MEWIVMCIVMFDVYLKLAAQFEMVSVFICRSRLEPEWGELKGLNEILRWRYIAVFIKVLVFILLLLTSVFVAFVNAGDFMCHSVH